MIQWRWHGAIKKDHLPTLLLLRSTTLVLIIRVVVEISFLILWNVLGEEFGNILVVFQENLGQERGHTLILIVVEGSGKTNVTNTRSTTYDELVEAMWGFKDHTNAMNVLIFTVVVDRREIEVDDVHDVAYIKTSTGNTSGDHDGSFARAECTDCIFALALSTIGVDGGGRQTTVEEVVVNEVCRLLGSNKHHGARGWQGDEKIIKSLLLGVVLDPDDLEVVREDFVSQRDSTYVLLDVDVSGTSSTDADTNMITGEVLLGQSTHLLVESS